MTSSRMKALALMQESLNTSRNKMFHIIGFVVERLIELQFTRLTVRVTDMLKTNDNIEDFYIYFLGDAKKFVDANAVEKTLVDVMGNINVSNKSTQKNQILKLEGRHVYVYKNFVNIYEEPNPKYYSPDDLDDSGQLAY